MNTTKRLTRSSTDKYVAGVSGGLGEHFGVDPTMVRVGWIFATLISGGLAEHFDVDPNLVRVGWIVATLFTGVAIFAYLAIALIVPRDDQAPNAPLPV